MVSKCSLYQDLERGVVTKEEKMHLNDSGCDVTMATVAAHAQCYMDVTTGVPEPRSPPPPPAAQSSVVECCGTK